MTILVGPLAAVVGSILGTPDPMVQELTIPRVTMTPDAGLELELEQPTDKAPVDSGLEWQPVDLWATCSETEGEFCKLLGWPTNKDQLH